MSLRIVLVDDHHLFRAGLKAAMSSHADLEVVGEASDARTALVVAEATRPNVVVLDVSLPGTDGISVARSILRGQSRARVLILTMHRGLDYVRQALSVGCSGYALKDQSPPSVIEAIRAVARGEAYLSPGIPRAAI